MCSDFEWRLSKGAYGHLMGTRWAYGIQNNSSTWCQLMCLILTIWPVSLDAHAAGSLYLAHASSFGSSVEEVNAFEDPNLAFSLQQAS